MLGFVYRRLNKNIIFVIWYCPKVLFVSIKSRPILDVNLIAHINVASGIDIESLAMMNFNNISINFDVFLGPLSCFIKLKH